MKIYTLTAFFLTFTLGITLTFSQDYPTTSNMVSMEPSGLIRCETTENEISLRKLYPKRATEKEFENWIAIKKQELSSQKLNSTNVVQTIPLVFHILTDANGTNSLTAELIQAQINQLNIDFNNLAGSTYTQAANSEIEFCLATQDENGVELTEHGINRITAYGSGPFTRTVLENNIKPATQWDPNKYLNVWVGDITGSDSETILLGYAQFPDSSGLDGLNFSNTGSENTDGVVVRYSTVGSLANPNPDGGNYPSGRTLTHEIGHFLGLRHTWGDEWSDGDGASASCGVDDYCDDTPNTGRPNFGCPSGGVPADTCTLPLYAANEPDMIENYMDYTYDSCMNTFTADQVTRMLTVLSNSPRRKELVASMVCEPVLNSEDFFIKNEIHIYPNPVKDKLIIKVPNITLPDGYRIYNMLGQLINESSINDLSDTSIDVEDLSNGVYFIKITKNNHSITLRFIKN